MRRRQSPTQTQVVHFLKSIKQASPLVSVTRFLFINISLQGVFIVPHANVVAV